MSSLRPEIDLLHDLGKQFFRWRKLYTGDIETNDLNIKTNTTTINVLTKLNELENLIGQGGGGSGTVTSINSISPDQNGNVLLDSININSSISPTNYIKDPNTDALDSHLKGIDNKLANLNNVAYKNINNNFSILQTFATGSKYNTTYNNTLISNPSTYDSDLLASMGWVNSKLTGLIGGMTYKGMYDPTLSNPPAFFSSAVAGDVWSIKSTIDITGIIFLTDDLIVFNQNVAGSLDSSKFDKIRISAGIYSINGFTNPSVSLVTDDILEDNSPTNLWFTNTRAKNAVVVDMSGNQTDQSPSVSSVKSYITSNISSNLKTAELTANTTISMNTYYVLTSSISNVTLTLPTITNVKDGDVFYIYKQVSSSGTKINANSSYEYYYNNIKTNISNQFIIPDDLHEYKFVARKVTPTASVVTWFVSISLKSVDGINVNIVNQNNPLFYNSNTVITDQMLNNQSNIFIGNSSVQNISFTIPEPSINNLGKQIVIKSFTNYSVTINSSGSPNTNILYDGITTVSSITHPANYPGFTTTLLSLKNNSDSKYYWCVI